MELKDVVEGKTYHWDGHEDCVCGSEFSAPIDIAVAKVDYDDEEGLPIMLDNEYWVHPGTLSEIEQ